MNGPLQIGTEAPDAGVFAPTQHDIANVEYLWNELHHRGVTIARMAALAREPFTGRIAEFPIAIRRQMQARQDIAMDAIADLLAITEPGLAALSAIEARGQDVTAPALALWREYHAAREALMALAFDGLTEG